MVHHVKSGLKFKKEGKNLFGIIQNFVKYRNDNENILYDLFLNLFKNHFQELCCTYFKILHLSNFSIILEMFESIAVGPQFVYKCLSSGFNIGILIAVFRDSGKVSVLIIRLKISVKGR